MFKKIVCAGAFLCLTACAAVEPHISEGSDIVSEIKLPSSYSSGLYADIITSFDWGTPAAVEDLATLEEWKIVNPSTFSLLICEELDIREPVLLANDNKQWLRTNIYGESDKAGTVFMDYRCNLKSNLVKLLHGHNMKDNSMFGNVPDLLELTSCSEAPLLHLVMEGYVRTYEVFAVLSVDATKEALPIPTMTDAEEVRAMSAELLGRSLVPDGVIHSDDVLLLNTCWYGESGMERYLHCIVAASRIS